MKQGKNGASIVVSMRLSPRANEVVRELAGRPRAIGRTVCELIMAEHARRQERTEAGKAKPEMAGE